MPFKIYKRSSPIVKGVILIIIANTFFAINMPVSRELTPIWINPLGLSLLRISFAFIAFFLMSKIMKVKDNFTIKEHISLVICGITGTSLNQLTFLLGLSMSSPVDASLIITGGPIVTMLFSALFLKERISLMKTIGVLVGLSGALLILYSSYIGSTINTTGSLKGNLIVVISVFSYATYLITVPSLMQKHSPVNVMKWTFFYGMITSLPFCYKYTGLTDGYGLTQVLELAYALIFGTFIAYTLVAFALQLLSPTTVSMFNYMQPVIASTIAIAIGQDILHWLKPVSALLIFSGVYLVVNAERLKRYLANIQNLIKKSFATIF